MSTFLAKACKVDQSVGEIEKHCLGTTTNKPLLIIFYAGLKFANWFDILSFQRIPKVKKRIYLTKYHAKC
jgi:hypothetical protein